ncbi:translation initiation factor IF-2-like [Perognathus longimembris pacificus]|uniref:translation initiation factor IF-2-like n=1 Tax=Perognathus longimembris pacificus TaxID=214514 RepID=UPI002019F2EF|nr:translation initiation factor IF-2-like [Perognathus longimembris pacificus]
MLLRPRTRARPPARPPRGLRGAPARPGHAGRRPRSPRLKGSPRARPAAPKPGAAPHVPAATAEEVGPPSGSEPLRRGPGSGSAAPPRGPPAPRPVLRSARGRPGGQLGPAAGEVPSVPRLPLAPPARNLPRPRRPRSDWARRGPSGSDWWRRALVTARARPDAPAPRHRQQGMRTGLPNRPASRGERPS